MADAYVDQGAYSSVLGTTPTWGVPQEGDGTATTAATASSVASIVLPGQPSAGNLLTICGLTLGATSGGTYNYTIGASLTATIDNICAAINGNAGIGAATVAAGVAYGVPKVCNLMFARNTGGTTVEIMMRVGSAKLNHAYPNGNVAISASGWSPTITQFAGGSGGCWGWFQNPSAMGVSNTIAAAAYGPAQAKPMVVGGGFAYAEGDDIIVRTGRNLAAFTAAPAANYNIARAVVVNLIFDDGTTWTGDSSSSKIVYELSAPANTAWMWQSGPAAFTSLRARQPGGLTIYVTRTGAGYCDFFSAGGNSDTCGGHLENVHFIERSSAYTSGYFRVLLPGGYSPSRYECSLVNCLFDFSAVARQNLISQLTTVVSASSAVGIYNIVGCDFRWTLTGVSGAALSVPLILANTSHAKAHSINVRGNTFTIGQSGELTLFSRNGAALPDGCSYRFENNKGAGLPAGAVGLQQASVAPDSAVLVLDNLGIGGNAKYEDRRGYFEFVAGQPVLSAAAPDGTLWSWIAYWTNSSIVLTAARPLLTPASRIQSRLSTAARSWSIELLCDSVSITNLPLYGYVELQYVNGSGAPVSERVPITLSSTSASWSNVGAAPYNTWTAKKITGTTAQSVLLNSIINIRLSLGRAVPGGSTATFAIDPEVALS